MTLRTLNYGNYGIFLIMGNAGFCPSAVGPKSPDLPFACQAQPEEAVKSELQDTRRKRGILSCWRQLAMLYSYLYMYI